MRNVVIGIKGDDTDFPPPFFHKIRNMFHSKRTRHIAVFFIVSSYSGQKF